MLDYSQVPSPCFVLDETRLRRNMEILDDIQKKPSTSELIDWIQALITSGVDVGKIVEEMPYPGVLLKKNEDLDTLKAEWKTEEPEGSAN